MSKEKQLDQQHRLLAIREHLRVKAKIDSREFEHEVARACFDQVQPIIEKHANLQGEAIIEAIAGTLGVRFEEVTGHDDIQRLEQKYLVEQRELGFGALEIEMAHPDVDAVLFQREHAHDGASDRWVAVLNLQATRARAYWSRPHELIHRIAEPPQQRLKFFRHKSDYENRLERLVDLGAAELAFPKRVFGPLVHLHAKEQLTWGLVKLLGSVFAPTASLQSVAKATLAHWPRPAFLLRAEWRAKKSDPRGGRHLRVDTNGFSPSAATTGIIFYSNMRVPPSSPLMRSFLTREESTEFEELVQWTTSSGDRLPSRRVLTSAVFFEKFGYGLISLDE